MKVLYIIGNGFDLNLKMKTSYHNFYNRYKNLVSKNEEIEKLKIAIKKKKEFWVDLEVALGDFTKQLNNFEEWDGVHFDLIKNLSKYLKREELKLENREFNTRKFFDDLSYPERHFPDQDKEKIQLIKNRWANQAIKIDIVTLNYTRFIQKITNGKFNDVPIGRNYHLNSLTHLHGDLETQFVLGVNDITQIANEAFRTDQNVLDTLVKYECNNANRNFKNRDFTKKINDANLICIFGSSIGITDKKWWELIGERLKKECHLLFFTRGEVIDPLYFSRQRRLETGLKNAFLKKANIPESEYSKLKDKIFVGYNSGMFSGLIIEKESQDT